MTKFNKLALLLASLLTQTICWADRVDFDGYSSAFAEEIMRELYVALGLLLVIMLLGWPILFFKLNNTTLKIKKLSFFKRYSIFIAIEFMLAALALAVVAMYNHQEIIDYMSSKRCDKCKKLYKDTHSCWYCHNHEEYFDEPHSCFFCSYHKQWHIQTKARKYRGSDRIIYRWKISDNCVAKCLTCGSEFSLDAEIHSNLARDNSMGPGICSECGWRSKSIWGTWE